MYRDPVVAVASGQTYERWAILEHWRRKQLPHDPLSNLPLSSGQLSIDLSKRREVEAFLLGNPGYIPDGWQGREVPASQEKVRWKQASMLGRIMRSRYLKWGFVGAIIGAIVKFLFMGVDILNDVGLLVKMIKAYPTSAWTVGNACAALANVAFQGAEQRVLIAEAGGIELIVRAMKMHVSDSPWAIANRE